MDLNEEIVDLDFILAKLNKIEKQWRDDKNFGEYNDFTVCINVIKITLDRLKVQNAKYAADRLKVQNAKYVAIEMRKFNRLLSLRDELCGSVQWKNDGGFNFYVYYCHTLKKWRWTSFVSSEHIAPIFTEDAAKKACEMLNDGHVIL